jgi:hypothetical protein
MEKYKRIALLIVLAICVNRIMYWMVGAIDYYDYLPHLLRLFDFTKARVFGYWLFMAISIVAAYFYLKLMTKTSKKALPYKMGVSALFVMMFAGSFIYNFENFYGPILTAMGVIGAGILFYIFAVLPHQIGSSIKESRDEKQLKKDQEQLKKSYGAKGWANPNDLNNL